MAQGTLSFKYEEEKKDFGTTAYAGSLVFLDLLHKMGFKNMVEHNLSAKEDKQGWSDYCFLVSVILLNLCGGDCVNDINGLEGDTGLYRIFKHLDLKNAFGRRRQKLIRQWRNGKINTFPSPTSIFRYLDVFHNPLEEEHRLPNKAFIPLPNENLLGLSGINKAMLEFLQINNPEKVATIDMDATIIRSQKEQAQYSYKKCKGYQPINAWWWEQDCMAYSEFRDGNVPAGFQQKRVLSETLSCLPPGVEKVYLRSDVITTINS
jgi:Transposase DDE domain group 1